MKEIKIGGETISTYGEYKEEVSCALREAAESFVYVGFLLRQAKENPDILDGSGYEDYKAFALGEFGLEETQTSRFIAINERYADGWELLPQYRGYGQSKLSEMLSLPVSVADELPKTITRAEIRDIKNEIKEEKETTDIEVAIERMENPNADVWEGFFRDWIAKNPEKFVEMSEDGPEGILEKCSLTARVKGEGKLLLTEKEEEMTLTSLRSGEKWRRHIAGCIALVFGIAGEKGFTKENWEEITGEKFPEIAPAQSEEKEETVPKPEETVSKPIETVSEETEEPAEETETGESEETAEDAEAAEVVEATVEDVPEWEPKKLSESEIASLTSDLENKAEVVRECINGGMWQRAYNTAKDILRGLERIMEGI